MTPFDRLRTTSLVCRCKCSCRPIWYHFQDIWRSRSSRPISHSTHYTVYKLSHFGDNFTGHMTNQQRHGTIVTLKSRLVTIILRIYAVWAYIAEIYRRGTIFLPPLYFVYNFYNK